MTAWNWLKAREDDIAVLLVVAIVSLLVLVVGAQMWRTITDDPNERQYPCTEDMACWDCETMGNLVCGKP